MRKKIFILLFSVSRSVLYLQMLLPSDKFKLSFVICTVLIYLYCICTNTNLYFGITHETTNNLLCTTVTKVFSMHVFSSLIVNTIKLIQSFLHELL